VDGTATCAAAFENIARIRPGKTRCFINLVKRHILLHVLIPDDHSFLFLHQHFQDFLPTIDFARHLWGRNKINKIV
jgi:hypothetical protein